MPMLCNPYKSRAFKENLGSAIWLESSYLETLQILDENRGEIVLDYTREDYLDDVEADNQEEGSCYLDDYPPLKSEEEIAAMHDYEETTRERDEHGFLKSPYEIDGAYM